MKKLLSSVLVLFMATSIASAQGGRPAPASPPDSATGKIGGATITVNYNSPSVKGRKIGVELAPYNKVWRAGANQPTTFQTDKNIKVGGKELPAGKYSLFILPTENSWDFIFNSEIPRWGIKQTGEASLDPSKNVLTVAAKPQKGSTMNERLVYQITNNALVLKWDYLEVPLPIQ